MDKIRNTKESCVACRVIGDYSFKKKFREDVKQSAQLVCRYWKRVCAHCGYDKHVEICHIKAVKDFPNTSTIGDINKEDNLILLCPNCHWEFDYKETYRRLCECGKRKSKWARYCWDCKQIKTKPKDKHPPPPKEILEQELQNNSMLKLSKKYKIGIRVVSRWIKIFDIKIHSRGYWNKQRAAEYNASKLLT